MRVHSEDELNWIIDQNYESLMTTINRVMATGRRRTGDDFQFWAHSAAQGDDGLMTILIVEALTRYDSLVECLEERNNHV